MYDAEFDRAEVMLGVLSQDSATQQFGSNESSKWRARSSWFGRSTWRSGHGYSNPVKDFERELQAQGSSWKPLQGGLFGGDTVRSQEALTAYLTTFEEAARYRG
ncbi:hypothetical protein ABLE68_07185 [Nocardioides sp. CN2-186]|uniref:hypothetical protein n=1 Tax=Nocardioides tweenelious TaxID=3156607 RepID=UPI0032B5C4EB